MTRRLQSRKAILLFDVISHDVSEIKAKKKFYKVINSFFLLMSFCVSSVAQVYIQKGEDLFGSQSEERFGYSISMGSPNTVAVGSYLFDSIYTDAGMVSIYEYDGLHWNLKGAKILGEFAGDGFGQAVSMPDPHTVGIGGPSNDVNSPNSGHVQVYKWNGSTWIQKGQDIQGEAANDFFGQHLVMPDENTIAIASRNNDLAGPEFGQVKIYVWDSGNWVQKGTSIFGTQSNANFGYSLAMPDSNTIIIGAPYHDTQINNAGLVRVFEWNGIAWTQKGSSIEGFNSSGFFGFSVDAISDSLLVISNRNSNINGASSGDVRLYHWNGNDWAMQSQILEGNTAGDNFGQSVAFGNDSKLVIGAIGSDVNGLNSGSSYVYERINNTWIQNSQIVHGDYPEDFNGISVSASKQYAFAVGADRNDQVATNSGQVRVFCFPTYSFQQITSCDSLLSPSGKYTYYTSGTYHDTLTNSLLCDSILTLDVTINNYQQESIIEESCDSFMNFSGTTNWTQSGTYYDTLQTANGCDSILEIQLDINQSAFQSMSKTSCGQYVSPAGNMYDTDGIFYDTLTTIYGCDSVVEIDLSISPIDTVIAHSANFLTVTTVFDSLLWVDCSNNYQVIVNNSNSNIFYPSNTGSYASILYLGSCVDTTECISFQTLSTKENKDHSNYKVLAKGSGKYILHSEELNFGSLLIFDASGHLIKKFWQKDLNQIEFEIKKSGIKILTLQNEGQVVWQKKLYLIGNF